MRTATRPTANFEEKAPPANNKITGTFVGGTGRYAGVTGDYEFSWRFMLENEDGTVQGQSVGLKGRVRLNNQQGGSTAGGSQ